MMYSCSHKFPKQGDEIVALDYKDQVEDVTLYDVNKDGINDIVMASYDMDGNGKVDGVGAFRLISPLQMEKTAITYFVDRDEDGTPEYVLVDRDHNGTLEDKIPYETLETKEKGLRDIKRS